MHYSMTTFKETKVFLKIDVSKIFRVDIEILLPRSFPLLSLEIGPDFLTLISFFFLGNAYKNAPVSACNYAWCKTRV